MERISLSTPVPVAQPPFRLTHQDRILLLGSCFSDSMGQRLQDAAFQVERNPFGVLYNPLSVAQCLQRCLADQAIADDDLVFQDGLWHSWLHHGSFSGPSKEVCLQACNQRLHQAHQFLAHCNTLVVTFGTAFVYRLASDGRVAGNCHKVPQKQFVKALLAVDEIVHAWREVLSKAASAASSPLRVVFTVSPIRHWRDGAHENALGKATLLLAIHELMKDAPTASTGKGVMISYYPSFEIVMDELRDYRFYADDMLHPSTLAQGIIWERFLEAYASDASRAIVQKAEQLARMKAHRPLFPESEAYAQYQQRVDALQVELNAMLRNDD